MDTHIASADIYSRPDGSVMADGAPGAVADAGGVERVRRTMHNFATMSEALRLLGAAVILASMSLFLLQGWQQGNDVSRYLLLLAQTGLLAAGGFALSFGLRENRGARIFFGLALIAVPANFTVLGALVYSLVQWDGALTQLPQIATWVVGGGEFGATMAAAMLALVPITLLGFAIMARRNYRALSLHYLLLNGLLLLPLRSSTPVGLVIVLGTLYALFIATRLAGGGGAMRTTEGRFALACLFIPLVVVTFRTVHFYQFDALLALMVSCALFVVLRQASGSAQRAPRLAVALQAASLPVALVAAMAAVGSLEGVLPEPFMLPVFALLFALMAGDTAVRSASRGLSRTTAALICVLLACCFVANVVVFGGAVNALACLVIGAAIALAGHALRHNVALFAGYAGAIVGLAFAISELVAMIVRSNWLELAVVGALAIVLGSVLERHGAALKLRLVRRFSRFAVAPTATATDAG